MGVQSVGGAHAEVDHLGGREWGKWIQKLRKSLNGAELDEGLLNLHLLVEVPLIFKKHFLALRNNIHGLLVALANGEQTLRKLENVDRPKEEWDSPEEVGAALGAEGGKELYCFLWRRGVCSTSSTKVHLETTSIKAMMYGAQAQ
jgi:hypothetical protein